MGLVSPCIFKCFQITKNPPACSLPGANLTSSTESSLASYKKPAVCLRSLIHS